jgi:hypothetical protein
MQFQKPFVFELRVRLCDGVWANNQLLSQGPDTWKLVAILQRSALHRMTDLLHQLQIERLAARRLQSEDHVGNCITGKVQMYSASGKQGCAASISKDCPGGYSAGTSPGPSRISSWAGQVKNRIDLLTTAERDPVLIADQAAFAVLCTIKSSSAKKTVTVGKTGFPACIHI